MESEFQKNGLNSEMVKWIEYPNKNEISMELRNKLVNHNPSYTCGVFVPPGCPWLSLGQLSCSYKHYLALKDIVENNYDYGVIMEDNIYFVGNIPEKINLYIKQLDEYYPDWDVIFDSNYTNYKEGELKEGIFVYPKSNEISNRDHGGTKCAQFYLLKKEAAKKLFDNYLPINNAPDWLMNDLFRKLNIKSFWAEPPNVHIFPHISTAN
jgi:GR25 family glycosyltransferase involved in LPS biosynthesis